LAGHSRNPTFAFALYHFFWCAIDWIYPPFCGGCNQPGTRWCPGCQNKVVQPKENICQRCGNFLHNNKSCPNCTINPPSYKILRSWGEYNGPLREAIHSLKYNRNIGLAEALSTHLVELLKELEWPVDLVIPVPLGTQRMRERGYNQASLLAYPLALACKIPYSGKALQRSRETPTQVGLTALQRIENVADAFKAKRSIVSMKSVLVIDDVTTTGATQNSCAQALLNAGAFCVYGLTLARAVFQSDAV
jgi:competence protein ComFC